MQRPVNITKHLDAIGPVGSMLRLKEIARLDLGKRSEAAKKVIKARLKQMRRKRKRSLASIIGDAILNS